MRKKKVGAFLRLFWTKKKKWAKRRFLKHVCNYKGEKNRTLIVFYKKLRLSGGPTTCHASKSRLRVHEWPVLQRFRRFTAHSFDSVRLVLVVAALVKRDLRVAFKRDDVGGDFVEEPSIVGDNESATVPGE